MRNLSSAVLAFHILCVSASAIDLWPGATVYVSVDDSLLDRGLQLSDDAACGLGASLAYDPVILEVEWHGMADTDPGRLADSRWDARFSGAAVCGDLHWKAGCEATLYESSAVAPPEDRYALFLGFSRDFAVAGRPSLALTCMADIEDEIAYYVDLDVGVTAVVSDHVDLTATGSIGAGEHESAEKQLSPLLPDEVGRWYDARAVVSMPIMFGRFDITPRIQYSSVLEADARRAISDKGLDPDNWSFGVVGTLYFD